MAESSRSTSLAWRLGMWGAILGLGVGIWGMAAWQFDTWNVETRWRLLAVFLPTILGLMLAPLPGGAVVLLAVLAVVLVGAMPLSTALSGYSNPNVWLVLTAFLMSRALINTGLARRIALTFIRLIGQTSLGLSYALVTADVLLAGLIPSNGARVGGVVLPITRSVAELYQSRPGPTAGLLGAFLMLTIFQADVMACALFLTGQTGNLLAAELGPKAAVAANAAVVPVMGYREWFVTASVPALLCLGLIPYLVYRLAPPEIRSTPDAAEFAKRQLLEQGRLTRAEGILAVIFVSICTLWMTLPAKETITPVAMCGIAALLLTGVLTWDDVVSEKAAWDVFIWYGGLVMLGEQLSQEGLTKLFAESVAGQFTSLIPMLLFLVLVLIYFYAHYAFAGITTHLLSMYPAFIAVLIAANVSGPLAVWSLALVANFSAGLTHYGTTHAPIVFGVGYVNTPRWWYIGLIISIVNLGIWLTLGMLWWKWLGLW